MEFPGVYRIQVASGFISKDDVDRFMTVHIECAEAQLAWAKGD